MKKQYMKAYVLRGMCFGGFGPIITGIVYFVLSLTLEHFSLSGKDVLIAVISTYLLAFIQAGASIFHQIEEWHLAKALFFHFLSIYLAYVGCYLVNSWIPFEVLVLFLFTVIFIVTYGIIWLTVYLVLKNISKKMNRLL